MISRPLAAIAAALLAGGCGGSTPMAPAQKVSLLVEVTGLPSAYLASVVLYFPDGTSEVIPRTTQLDALAPGNYRVFAQAEGNYVPDPSIWTTILAPGDTATVEIIYRFNDHRPCHVLTSCNGP